MEWIDLAEDTREPFRSAITAFEQFRAAMEPFERQKAESCRQTWLAFAYVKAGEPSGHKLEDFERWAAEHPEAGNA